MKKKNVFVPAILMFVVFVIYTLVVKTADVQAIGPEGSSVGLASLNGAFHELTGVNEFWYDLTKYLGVLAIGICGCFGLLGLVQLIQGKSLKAVDVDIYVLAGTYVVTMILYVLFEKVVINYRPVILDAAEGLEASYPSSHSMLIMVVMMTAAVELGMRLENAGLRKAVIAACYVITAITVIGRLICGVHWLTDIVGGVILGAAIYVTYKAVLVSVKAEK